MRRSGTNADRRAGSADASLIPCGSIRFAAVNTTPRWTGDGSMRGLRLRNVDARLAIGRSDVSTRPVGPSPRRRSCGRAGCPAWSATAPRTTTCSRRARQVEERRLGEPEADLVVERRPEPRAIAPCDCVGVVLAVDVHVVPAPSSSTVTRFDSATKVSSDDDAAQTACIARIRPRHHAPAGDRAGPSR